ncbi:hypothetical protein AL036_22235 [Salipiger aestuarii]|uniref:Uncharacterized protein n=1 Tax=Salipiger aestuarii TaxID=568098 RepID=A0A327XH18_9RHOB|nr:hypothetical protein [Salipiger aestuarii]EIE52389.1 hypothetical protein C357_03940 [Citreicella sp. 357]KAA8603574.1 hypothetical protein AL036_22235 [Salipiger aestuarii]KAA8610533.1 hypothetical protein AL037_13110 [Salipiger aestuarii]KAB2530778.1 hypothetical protein AL035_21755 [Salipiger aestuarii]RAK07146.1 hypothetical protein ATI53_11101 [Salipiger aestuarii]
MTSRIDQILARIDALHDELEIEIARRRETFRYRLEQGRVKFEADARARNARAKIGLAAFLARANPWHIATAPFIYALIVPFALLDLFVSVYQAVCFRAYGIPRVRRGDHIRIDRHHLGYLNGMQKLNCVYCGYCNGLLSYVSEIASRTEAFWCPIKHAARVKAPHARYAQFLDYGDADGFQNGLEASREALKKD